VSAAREFREHTLSGRVGRRGKTQPKQFPAPTQVSVTRRAIASAVAKGAGTQVRRLPAALVVAPLLEVPIGGQKTGWAHSHLLHGQTG